MRVAWFLSACVAGGLLACLLLLVGAVTGSPT